LILGFCIGGMIGVRVRSSTKEGAYICIRKRKYGYRK
jgi:hypothetical protein